MDCTTLVYKSDRKSGEDEFTNESKNHDVEAFIIKVILSCTLDESYIVPVQKYYHIILDIM